MTDNLYSSYDYLFQEPYYIEGIGFLKCPTLLEIRKMTYDAFNIYLSIISSSFTRFIKVMKLEEIYEQLNDEEKERFTIYNILLHNYPQLLIGILSAFCASEYKFDEKTLSFNLYDLSDKQSEVSQNENGNDERKPIGHIGNDNFEIFQIQMQVILGIKEPEDIAPTFKNELARKYYEKMQKHKEEQKEKKKHDDTYSMDNMILKFCINNHVGINLLNVGQLTYYQFNKYFNEYNHARQCEFNDNMAANTFSYKKANDYKPAKYMERLDK